MIENARRDLKKAQEAVESAKREVQWRNRALEELLAR
jgi:hypothetical protein